MLGDLNFLKQWALRSLVWVSWCHRWQKSQQKPLRLLCQSGQWTKLNKHFQFVFICHLLQQRHCCCPWGWWCCRSSCGKHKNGGVACPSPLLAQPSATLILFYHHFPISLVASKQRSSMEGAHVLVLAFRLILGTHMASIIPINKRDQKVGEKSVNEQQRPTEVTWNNLTFAAAVLRYPLYRAALQTPPYFSVTLCTRKVGNENKLPCFIVTLPWCRKRVSNFLNKRESN